MFWFLLIFLKRNIHHVKREKSKFKTNQPLFNTSKVTKYFSYLKILQPVKIEEGITHTANHKWASLEPYHGFKLDFSIFLVKGVMLAATDFKLSLSKKYILNQIWKYASNVDTHTVETHIYRLRKKISDLFDDEKFILSHKNGYYID